MTSKYHPYKCPSSDIQKILDLTYHRVVIVNVRNQLTDKYSTVERADTVIVAVTDQLRATKAMFKLGDDDTLCRELVETIDEHVATIMSCFCFSTDGRQITEFDVGHEVKKIIDEQFGETAMINNDSSPPYSGCHGSSYDSSN